MNEKIRKLKGANMDIDLATPQGRIEWEQDRCPWNEAEHTNIHKCAVKNVGSLGIAVIAQHSWRRGVMRHHGVALHLAVDHGNSWRTRMFQFAVISVVWNILTHYCVVTQMKIRLSEIIKIIMPAIAAHLAPRYTHSPYRL